jgi:hypothetical protein
VRKLLEHINIFVIAKTQKGNSATHKRNQYDGEEEYKHFELELEAVFFVHIIHPH